MQKQINQVAIANNVSIGEVLFEIDKAIDCAISNAHKHGDVASKWDTLFPDGEVPSVEALIKRLAEEVRERMNAS